MTPKVIAATFAVSLAMTAGTSADTISQEDLLGLDKDGNGSVSMTEFEAFADFAFEALDVDKNGALSKTEVEAHAKDGAFERSDSNGDGSISAAEFRARMDANFKAADQDGDGQLN